MQLSDKQALEGVRVRLKVAVTGSVNRPSP